MAVHTVPSAEISPFSGPLGPMTVTSASWPSVAVTVMRWPGSTFFCPEGWAAIVARDCSDGTTVWKSTLAAGVQALTTRTAPPDAEEPEQAGRNGHEVSRTGGRGPHRVRHARPARAPKAPGRRAP